MSTTVETIISKLCVLERTIANVRAAFESVPEQITPMPCFVNWPSGEDTTWQTFEGLQTVYHIVAELHVARADLKTAEAQARPFIDRFRAAVMGDPTLTGTVANTDRISARYQVADVAGEQHLVVRFELDLPDYGGATDE